VDSLGGEELNSGCSQFDRQGQTIQVAADLRNSQDIIWSDLETRFDALGVLNEKVQG
jgi:hypothetical protein